MIKLKTMIFLFLYLQRKLHISPTKQHINQNLPILILFIINIRNFFYSLRLYTYSNIILIKFIESINLLLYHETARSTHMQTYVA